MLQKILAKLGTSVRCPYLPTIKRKLVQSQYRERCILGCRISDVCCETELTFARANTFAAQNGLSACNGVLVESVILTNGRFVIVHGELSRYEPTVLRGVLLVPDHDLLDLSILTKILIVRHNTFIGEHGRQSDYINRGLFNNSNLT